MTSGPVGLEPLLRDEVANAMYSFDEKEQETENVQNKEKQKKRRDKKKLDESMIP